MSSDAALFRDALARATGACEEASNKLESRLPPFRNAQEEPIAEQLRELSDERLLEQIRDGSKEALGFLFRRHARVVRKVAHRLLRDEGEADDLLQEVFIFVFRKACLFDPHRGSARSWLVQVTYHRAFDRRRYLVSRGFYANLGIEETVTRAEEPRAAVFSYEDTIEAAIGQDTLRRIEASLSEVQRRVLHLRFFEGQSIEEIAATIVQSAGNVRNHYYRALEKMRREVFGTKLKAK